MKLNDRVICELNGKTGLIVGLLDQNLLDKKNYNDLPMYLNHYCYILHDDDTVTRCFTFEVRKMEE